MLKTIKKYYRMLGINGAVCVIKSKITDSVVFCRVNKYNCNYPFTLRFPSSDIPTLKQIFIDREYDFLVNKEPRVIIDAGANIGLASIYFINKYKNAKIIAIEPEKSNFELLKKNVAPYPNVIPVNAALWNKNEEINLVDPGLGNWGFMTESDKSSEKKSGMTCHKVMAMTMDKIISDYKLDKIDILKMDIEGAEKEVFSNAASWIEKVDAIIVELHEHMKEGCNSSFYRNTRGFDNEWRQGENIYLSRGDCLTRKCIETSLVDK